MLEYFDWVSCQGPGNHIPVQTSKKGVRFKNHTRKTLKSVHFTRKLHQNNLQPNPSIQQRHYNYDKTGNLVHIDDTHRGSLQYRYDPLGQLLSAIQPNLSETFAYDPAGNLLDPVQERRRSPRQAPDKRLIPQVTYNLLKKYLGNVYEYDHQGNCQDSGDHILVY
jgi:YD repeat-containing protein